MDENSTGTAGKALNPPPVFPDPLGDAVKKLFGLSYLFPYQRLVVTNLLEAAATAGFPVRWPEEPEGTGETGASGNGPDFAAAGADQAKTAGEAAIANEAAETGPAAAEARATPGSEGADLGRQIVILPTGAGKSLCFQLPAMLLEGPTLVIYPILSLMADQERRLRERGFEPALLRGGQDEAERSRIWERLAAGKSRFIIANPEVLLTGRMLEKLKTLGILHVVIDEAHCVSEWGESFRPAYLRLQEIVSAAGSPLVTAFTATASAPVLEKIESYVFGAPARRIIGNPDRSNIRYRALGCILRDLAVRDLLTQNPLPAIVFCSSRPGTEKLSRYLMEEFREAGRPEARQPELKRPEAKRPDAAEIRFYHAGLSREEKTAVEKWFFDNPRGILVSTCAYGMGVDKADIRTVIHRDCPPSVEAYLQESGRAGRDGKASEAILLWGPGDERPRGRSETEQRRMAALLAYARDGQRCRREALLRLLDYESSGDRPETRCCDVCDREEQRPETGAAGGTSGGTAKGTARRASRGREKAAGGLREEGPLLDFFRRNRRVFTQKEAVRVLSAAENIRWTEEDAKQAVKELIRMKKLKISRNPLWQNKISIVRREELEGRRENWKIAPFASIARERASETADNKTPHSSLLPPPSQLFFFQPQFVIGAFLTIFGFV